MILIKYRNANFRDHGLVNLFLTNPESFSLETIVFNELCKRYPGNLYYLKDNYEVDFFVPDRMLVQVLYKMNESKTREKELSSLLKAAKTYHAWQDLSGDVKCLRLSSFSAINEAIH